MDQNFIIIHNAKQILSSRHIDVLPKEVCETVSNKHTGKYLSGLRLGYDSDGVYVYSMTWVYVLYYLDESGKFAEELLITSNNVRVFSAEGHNIDDYKTTYFIDDDEWQKDLISLGYIVRAENSKERRG